MTIDWKSLTLENLAGLISRELRNEGIDLVLVGGACVTIYSKNRYLSYDLDFVTYEDLSRVKKALKKLGFTYTAKYFRREDCPWFVEFVSPPIAVGDEPITDFAKLKTQMGTVKMLTATDAVKDRLASYYHWRDRQGLEQALNICREVKDLNWQDIERWSKKEGYPEKYRDFLNALKEE